MAASGSTWSGSDAVTCDTALTTSSSQSLHRRGFYCCQGLVNLNDCGPEDGGLIVLEGSSKLVEEFFDIHGRESYNSWGPFDWYGKFHVPVYIVDPLGSN
jgi:hypothetical protein